MFNGLYLALYLHCKLFNFALLSLIICLISRSYLPLLLQLTNVTYASLSTFQPVSLRAGNFIISNKTRKDTAMVGRFTFKKPVFRGAIGAMVYCLLAFSIFGSPSCLDAATLTEESAVLSIGEKEQLVEQGVTQYKKGDIEAAQKTFEQAKAVFPSNFTVPYYLGLIYLEENRRSDAIAEWQRYVLMDPRSEESLKIRKYLTLLIREEAVAYAKEAVANEAALLNATIADNTLAVTSFKYIGSGTLGPLGKGLATMLITDLSTVPDLQVVERVKLQMLLQELDLGTSGVVGPETVPKVGKLLKSRHVATGSLLEPGIESLQIVSALVDTERKEDIDTREVQGALADFFNLEKNIACGIIEDLGRSCDDMPGSFHRIHTKSLAALASFSIGLDYLDQQKYDQAREQFQKAIDEDPEFDLAKETLAVTPLSTMLLLTSSQMVSTLSGTAASSTTIGSAAAGSAAAAGGGIGVVGITAGVIAGAAAVAGLAAGGSGGGGGSTIPTADVNLTGNWVGTWTDSSGNGGEISLTLTQTNTSVSGTATVSGPDCLLTGSLSGSVEGRSFQANISSGTGLASFNANCTNTAMNGTLNVTSGSCAGHSGTVSTSITGNANIRW